MRQISVFPVKIVQLDPAGLGTADAAHTGVGDNGLDYCIKTVAKTPAVPAAELICNSLASACGIPTAQFDIVLLPDGSEAFGSVWDGSAADKQTTVSILTGAGKAKSIRENLSRIYAFDLFVHNEDRHLNNYLCVPGNPAVAGHAIKAFDFSRAFTAIGWPLPDLPMNPASRTVTTIRQLTKAQPLDFDKCQETLQRIDALPYAMFKSIVESVPAAWLAKKERNAVIDWWTNGRLDRTLSIRGGLKNGQYL